MTLHMLYFILSHSSAALHQAATTIQPQTGQVSNPYYLVSMAPVKAWDIFGSK